MKFYIDSRDRKEGSNESFIWAPPINLDLETPHVAIVDTCLIPNTFKAVSNNNNKLYIYEVQPLLVPAGTSNIVLRITTIAPGHYNANTIAAAVQAALNAGSVLAQPYVVTYSAQTNKLTISNTLDIGATYAIYPSQWLRDNGWQGNKLPDYEDAGWVCGFLGNQALYEANGVVVGDSTVNLAAHHNLFIRSSFGKAGQCYGAGGATDIVRRIIMDGPPNSLIVDRHATSYDTVEMNSGSYSSIEFRLCDFQGRVVDLSGQPWSFSLCIHPS